ncbi:transcriptional regulator [Alicyclobacillus cellulosilyticus]|uniref:Transcriptional regulator CtsR n=1 Tax=Alicyclobacillus cellulosilyticus TaxID=1003997 RepID=A0A917K530_9BACL|nr:CtsR family transcriptional regulator [Alicyclobacillus cellulosilyticus]GGJ01327.1 transcriptional regulator [Alicyclobacillus cellulosilyticus]
MTRNMSDIIEAYLKRILQEAENGVVEVQRSELAELFQCVPSQINYVIGTRFTVDQGYIVESKRGGGGYIRIRQITCEGPQALPEVIKQVGERISQREAEGLIERLHNQGTITSREASMLRAAMSRDIFRMELPARDEVRARLLTQMLIALLGSA